MGSSFFSLWREFETKNNVTDARTGRKLFCCDFGRIDQLKRAVFNSIMLINELAAAVAIVFSIAVLTLLLSLLLH